MQGMHTAYYIIRVFLQLLLVEICSPVCVGWICECESMITLSSSVKAVIKGI